jgi:hypothetical protein
MYHYEVSIAEVSSNLVKLAPSVYPIRSTVAVEFRKWKHPVSVA